MIVILPSGLEIPVPVAADTAEGLKTFLDAATGIPSAVQRLYVDTVELGETQSLRTIPDDARIDLVIAVGEHYAICRAGLDDKLDGLSGEVLVSAPSNGEACRPESLLAPVAIDLDHLGPVPFDDRVRQQRQQEAARYFSSFESDKAGRRDRLRRIRERLDDGLVVVSAFNWGYRRLVENWAASCDRHGIDCRAFTLLFPTDEGADAFARRLGFETYFDGLCFGEQPVEANETFGDANFRKSLFAKIAMTEDMLAIGADIVRQDVDVVWRSDPRGYLTRRMERERLDFLFMHDGPNRLYQPLYYNSGFIGIRNNTCTRIAWNLIFSNYARILHYGGEQRVINVVMNCLRERGLRTGRLPEERFVNGHVISRVLDTGGALPPSGEVIHASWTSDIRPKIAHLAKFGLWYL